MRELLTVDNDPTGILRSTCRPVVNIKSEVKSLADDLVNYLLDHREDEVVPLSISAPQLGENIRVIAYYPNPKFKDRLAIQVLINPELAKVRKYLTLRETCLSIPGKDFQVRRANRVTVKGLDINGRPRTVKGESLLAQMLQHEINHLNGVLIDSIGELVKEE